MDADRLCRIVIDVRRLQSNVLRSEGGLVRERDLRKWLQCIGFRPEPDGITWRGQEECLSNLDQSEFLRLG